MVSQPRTLFTTTIFLKSDPAELISLSHIRRGTLDHWSWFWLVYPYSQAAILSLLQFKWYGTPDHVSTHRYHPQKVCPFQSQSATTVAFSSHFPHHYWSNQQCATAAPSTHNPPGSSWRSAPLPPDRARSLSLAISPRTTATTSNSQTGHSRLPISQTSYWLKLVNRLSASFAQLFFGRCAVLERLVSMGWT